MKSMPDTPASDVPFENVTIALPVAVPNEVSALPVVLEKLM